MQMLARIALVHEEVEERVMQKPQDHLVLGQLIHSLIITSIS
jgi:hypothetical protein